MEKESDIQSRTIVCSGGLVLPSIGVYQQDPEEVVNDGE